jgi:hypothetical protein
MGYTQSENFPELIVTMKRAWAALEEAGIEVLLGGGLAAWALGGPPTDHDVDFYLREQDAERALSTLAGVGMRTERPPEGWLFKAYDGDVLVDLIFRPSGGDIDDGHFERATELDLMAQRVRVASIDDVMTMRLLALSEQEPDFSAVIEVARSLREQVDWEEVRQRTEDAPFAAAFFTLVERLGIIQTAARGRTLAAVPTVPVGTRRTG